MSAFNTVKFKLESKNPPPLTSAQRERLKAIAAMPDAEIDYSDMARQSVSVQWTKPGALIPAENKLQGH